MVISIRVNGKITYLKVMVNLFMRTDICLKEIGKKESAKERENKHTVKKQ
jgi:hypothetical protein